jgi:K(+)-stimulated pyrophosphate-energized sodium pump
MLEISELIYETCKTYLITQGKFILMLWALHRRDHVVYFGSCWSERFPSSEGRDHPVLQPHRHRRQLRRRLVRHPRQHLRQLAHRLRQPPGKPFPCYAIPLKAGMSIGMLLISSSCSSCSSSCSSSPRLRGPCFIGFAIGESLGAAALRIAGGIFTKIADIGSDLMKIVFKIKEDDARNPGVIADCTGDNAGDSVGPSADGFETYGVTGVALITFILLAVRQRPGRAGPAAGLDLHDARHDGRRLGGRTSSTKRSPRPSTATRKTR